MARREKVLELERTWDVAPLEGDLDPAARVVANDWVGVTAPGETVSRTDLLEIPASELGVFDAAIHDDVSVRVFGAAAVVTSAFYRRGIRNNADPALCVSTRNEVASGSARRSRSLRA